MKSKITIDGKIYDVTDVRSEENMEINREEVLGLFGMQPGIYDTIITYPSYFITIELDSTRNPFFLKELFVFALDKTLPQKGWISSMSQTGKFIDLEIRTMPTQKTRFIPR